MYIPLWLKKKVCAFVSEGKPGCQRTQRPGSRYCLGHDPDPKDYQEFMDGLFAELNDPTQSSLNAEGWVFQPDEAGMIKLERPFSKRVNFKNAQFRGDVYFNSSQFPEGVDFTGAHFHGSADFTATIFPEVETKIDPKTTFDDAHFDEEVIFEGTEFHEDVSFVNCHVKGELKMNAATKFTSDAFFTGMQLEGEATLSGANFEGITEFKGALFKKHTRFIGSKFKGQVLFEGTNFVDLVEFSNAHFHALASFPAAVFQQRTLFEGTKFLSEEDVKFEYTNFNDSSSFKKCEFHGESYFTQTNFVKKADFTKTIFEKPVNFEGAIFNEVNFVETEFKKKVRFAGTRFNGWAQFSKPKFLSETIFEGVQFSQITVLDDATFGQDTTFNVQVNERNRLAIRNSDLSKVKFSLSNIENIEFQDATWIKTRFIYRWKIADEESAGTVIRKTDEIKKLQNARRLYRQLRLNHDKVGEYAIAGKFYCSESEMNYLLLPPVLRWIHPRGLYKWASKYGESILQAVSVLFVLIFVFAIFYYEFSAKRPQIWFKEPPKTLATLNPATPNVTTPQSMITLSWWESVWLSMQASKPLADVGLSPKTILYWVVLAQGFIVPTQVGLFLLAIRRRFRRGD